MRQLLGRINILNFDYYGLEQASPLVTHIFVEPYHMRHIWMLSPITRSWPTIGLLNIL